MIETLHLNRNDRQPYYRVTAKDSALAVINIAGATIYCTMVAYDPATGVIGTTKINRQDAGINITDGAAGEFEYRWQATDTDLAGTYYIEFEIVPAGDKYTFPNPSEGRALVVIQADLDST